MKKEFSKTLLIQESALMWITTFALIVLAFYCIQKGYLGSLPWITAMAGFPWTAYGVSQAFYYNKSKAENTVGGVKYETVMNEQNAANIAVDPAYYSSSEQSATYNTIDPWGPI